MRHCGLPGVRRADDWSQLKTSNANTVIHQYASSKCTRRLCLYIAAYIAGLKIRKAGLATIEATNKSTVASFNHFILNKTNKSIFSLSLLYFDKYVPSLTPN